MVTQQRLAGFRDFAPSKGDLTIISQGLPVWQVKPGATVSYSNTFPKGHFCTRLLSALSHVHGEEGQC